MGKNLLKFLSKEILEYEYEKHKSMQKVAESLNVSIDSIYKYMKLYNIKYNKSKNKYICNSQFFNEETEQSFYWAGFIAADGSVQYRKYSKILKLCLSNKDSEHIELFKNNLKSTHPIKKYLVKPSKLVNTMHPCAELQIASSTLVDGLQKFNILPNKTKNYNMPNWILDHQYLHHYMRGYFDGDGTITQCGLAKNRNVYQGCFSIIGSELFINNYKNILVQKVLLNDVKITKHKSLYKLSYSGNNNIKNIYDFLYNQSNVCLKRKQVKFNKFKPLLKH